MSNTLKTKTKHTLIQNIPPIIMGLLTLTNHDTVQDWVVVLDVRMLWKTVATDKMVAASKMSMWMRSYR